MFHLFEFDGAENEVSGGDFIAERFADLRDAEGDFCARGALNVQKVYEFALRRFGTQINFILALVRNAAGCFEHKVECTDGRPVMLAAVRAGNFVFRDVGFHFLVGHGVWIDIAFGMRFDQIVSTETRLAFFAVHFRVGKGSGMTAGFPNSRIHQDRRVNTEGVIAFLYEFFPPCAFDVVFDFHAYGAIIPGVSHAAVNFAAGENDPACFAKVYDLIHRYCVFICHDVPQYQKFLYYFTCFAK